MKVLPKLIGVCGTLLETPRCLVKGCGPTQRLRWALPVACQAGGDCRGGCACPFP